MVVRDRRWRLHSVALLGAITHQALAVWVPANAAGGSFFGRFRAVPSAAFANAIVLLIGGIVYLDFLVEIRPALEQAGNWTALGLFDLKEHFIAIGLVLLPAYWVCWRQPSCDEPARIHAALTTILAFIVWWAFLIGHVMNNIRGFGA